MLEAISTVLGSWKSGRKYYQEICEFDTEPEDGFRGSTLEVVEESDDEL